MGGLTGAAVAGAGAGIGVAMPLGAIGVLLVQQAISAGWRSAAGGALGVAQVDLGYAVIALVAGAGLTRALDGHERAVQVVGAAILVLVAVRGMLGLRPARQDGSAAPQPLVEDNPAGQAVAVGHRSAAWRMMLRFLALTAINPLTAVYFVALAAGSGAAVQGRERSVVFAAGVFIASLSWQLLLVTAGAAAGGRLGERARFGTGLLGYLVVLGYATKLATGAG